MEVGSYPSSPPKPPARNRLRRMYPTAPLPAGSKRRARICSLPLLHQPGKKVFFYLFIFNVHFFKYVLICPHHVQGAGYIKGSLFIVRNHCLDHVFIYSAYHTTPISWDSVCIGQRIERLDTKL